MIVGIDQYEHHLPLSYATNDALAVAELIRKAFFAYTRRADVQPDDRLFVFVAGHGHTVRGMRGEPIGFFMPVDGDTDDLASLIRWDDLTRNADLIPAKHVFFVIDACYGGLASLRGTESSERFVQDMLRCRVRQVLSAGLSDEMVTDGDGVRPGHSIFTSQLLSALEGAAAMKDDVITATEVMSYVRRHVAIDSRSRQTPGVASLEGEGDFVFNPECLSREEFESWENRDHIALLCAGVRSGMRGARRTRRSSRILRERSSRASI